MQTKANMHGKLEILWLTSILAAIFICAYYTNDTPAAVISAVCGILYTFIAGKGRVVCYLFGLCGSGFYAYLAFKNGLYGNFLLYLCLYIPMQIVGIFKWKKHLNKASNTIIKISLGTKERIFLCFISVFSSIIATCVLFLLKGSNPLFDGITLVLSVIGMYLTVRRAVEQWVIWVVVNFLSVCIWINLLLCGEKVCSTVMMWGAYLFLAVYFYIDWTRELKATRASKP